MPQVPFLNRTAHSTSLVDVVADVDYSIAKFFALLGITALFAGITGYFIGQAEIMNAAIAGAVFLAFFNLQSFLIKDWKRMIVAVFIEALALLFPILIVFYDILSFQFIWVLVAPLALLIMAQFSGRKEMHNSLHIPFWRSSKRVLTGASASLIIFFCVVYFFGGLWGGTSDLTRDKVGVVL